MHQFGRCDFLSTNCAPPLTQLEHPCKPPRRIPKPTKTLFRSIPQPVMSSPLTFTLEAKCGRARAGRIGPLFTPGALLQTQFGQPASLTPTMLSALSGGGAGVRAGHLLGHESLVSARNLRIADYSRLGDRLAVLSQHEPSRPPADATDNGVWMETWGGRKILDATSYATLACTLRTDLAVTLHDEPPAGAGKNRVRAAAQRSALWAEECSKKWSTSLATSPAALFFLPLGCEEPMRENAVARVKAAATTLGDIRSIGFVIGGASGGINSVTVAALENLPEKSLRVLPCVGAPQDVLKAITAGIDLFDSDYPELLSRFGYVAAWAIDSKDAIERKLIEGGGEGKCATRGDGGFREWVDISAGKGGGAGASSEASGSGGAGGGAGGGGGGGGGGVISGDVETEKDESTLVAPFALSHGTSRRPTKPTKVSAKGFSGGGTGGEVVPLPEAITALSSDVTKLDMIAARFIEDSAPLVAGCTCYACAGTTAWPSVALAALGTPRDGRSIHSIGASRRYVHHLLLTQEMLGRVLLTVHNTHHYNRWLEVVREVVKEGRLEEYIKWWEGENT
jgi:queuine/archaeosine tRNA-ribosyltransferase